MYGKKLRICTGEIAGSIRANLRVLEPSDQLQIEHTGRQPVGQRVGSIGKVLDQHIGDGIIPVDEVEDLKSGPYILEVAEGAMAAPVAFFTVQQQGAKAYVDADIGGDRKGIAITDAARDIEGQVAAVKEVEEYFQVLIGRKVILHKKAEGEKSVGGASYPARPGLGAVNGMLQGVEGIGVIGCIDPFHGLHKTQADPAFGILYQLAEQAEFQAGGVGFGIILPKVLDMYIVDVIGVDLRHLFVISFCSPAEGTGPYLEVPFEPGDDLPAALRFQIFVEGAIRS